MDQVVALRVLSRVVETGSFSEAGRQLGMTPSSVSRQIGDLEQTVGARLFNRTTRKLSLTEAGTIYHDRTAKILFDLEEAHLAVAQEDGTPSGVLRMSVPSGLGRELIASALPVFLQKHPGIKIVMSMTDQVVDMVAAGLDLGIRIGQLRDSSLIAKKIGSSRRVVCASPAYLRKAGIPKTPEDLAAHNCLTWRDQPGKNVWCFRGPKGQSDIAVSGNLFATNADALIAAAVAGLGLVLMPDWAMGIEIKQKKLRAVLEDFEPIPGISPVYAVYPHQSHLPLKVRAFIDFLSDRFATTEKP